MSKEILQFLAFLLGSVQIGIGGALLVQGIKDIWVLL